MPTTTLPRHEELLALRQYLSMTQIELGDALHVGGKYPGQMISRYERGAIPLPSRVLTAVRLLVMAMDKEEKDADAATL